MNGQNKSPPRHLPPDKMIERLNDVRQVVEGFDDYLFAKADQAEEIGEQVGTEPPVTITVSQAYSILNVFQFIRCSAEAIQEALARAIPDAPHKERQDIVPGMMRCAKCNFVLSRTNLYLQSGTTGPGDNKTEPCPNGCGPLWPLTWKERALDAEAMLEKEIETGSPRDITAAPNAGRFPIPLNDQQLKTINDWAGDDRLWRTPETVELNLTTFARTILASINPPAE